MADAPCSSDMREKAFMMNAEKAKKTPAINPLPMQQNHRVIVRMIWIIG
jgi:hypothetical protein